MKKSVSLKLIIFSFLLVSGSITYSATPTIEAGTGTDSTKAGINNNASGENSTAVGFYNEAKGKDSSAIGYGNGASGESSSAVGNQSTASGKESSAFGNENLARGERSLAFGFGNTTSGKKSSAFGNQNKASGERSSAFGYNNEVTDLESSVLGNNYKVTGNHSGAFGIGTYDEVHGVYKHINGGGNSYMIGNDNNIAEGASDNFILGNGVNIGVDSNGRKIQSSVVLGHGSSVSESEVVSVGTPDGGRRIVNVREARITATSNDATTGKQLYQVAKAIVFLLPF